MPWFGLVSAPELTGRAAMTRHALVLTEPTVRMPTDAKIARGV